MKMAMWLDYKLTDI